MNFFRTTFLQMDFLASIMIIAIIIFRAIGIHYVPKRILVVSWCIIIIRLLVPLSISLPVSIPIHETVPSTETFIEKAMSETTALTNNLPDVQAADHIPLQMVLWSVGFGICALYFGISYLICRYKFSQSSQIENEVILCWLKEHSLKRRIRIRSTPNISSPLTYGIVCPTILLPSNLDFNNSNAINFILLHEYMHIRYYDSIIKFFLVICVCVHWFNPLVWMMFLLANRDIELSCDERVVLTLGEKLKSTYALTLIELADSNNLFNPVLKKKKKNAITERIEAIMKMRKSSLLATTLALTLMLGSTSVFAASAADEVDVSPSDAFAPNAMVMQATDNLAAVSTTSTAFNASNKETTAASNEAAANVSEDLAEIPAPQKNISLSPGTSFKYDKTYFEAGTQIDIYANWTPTSVNLDLGVYSASTGSKYTDTVSNGEGGVTVTINKSGYFYIYVANTSSSKSADISLSYAY